MPKFTSTARLTMVKIISIIKIFVNINEPIYRDIWFLTAGMWLENQSLLGRNP